jgi:XTP/dITP diphosphohydrolase
VFVTQNKHKLAELSPLFKKFGVSFETSSLEKFEVRSDDVETVALHAAENAYRELQRPAVVDDTGLFIDSLSGFPMVYPGFVLNTIGKEGILRLLEGVKDRGAKFVTAVGFSNGADNLTFVDLDMTLFSFQKVKRVHSPN